MTVIVSRASRPVLATGDRRLGAPAVARIWAWLVRRRRIASDRRRLQALPEEMLRDIGIGRSEIYPATEYGRGILSPR